MLYLNKFLERIKFNPSILKSKNVILEFGLTSTNIKNLKKYALENQLITQEKQGFFLTAQGEKYLAENSLRVFETKMTNFSLKINVEYFKEEKIPSVLTKAMRNLSKYLLENQNLKECSLEFAIWEDIKKSERIISEIEKDILNEKRNYLDKIFQKYIEKGLTKSLCAVFILTILSRNLERIAIYEKNQFQLNFDTLMFDRMIACPQNFEIQKTEMSDEFLLKDISRIILNKKSYNILEITKGLYKTIKQLDKYTMNTQNLSTKTLRLRNTIVNAKDPISLFKRDIPKVLANKELKDCDRKFLDDLKNSLNELKNCINNLVEELKYFLFDSFKTISKEELSERFLNIKDFLNEKELKVLLNTVIDINVPDDLWINRIATFVNKSRVPKDWSDEDYADFKVKLKELALKFFVLESTIGTNENMVTENYYKVLKNFVKLSKQEQMVFLRKAIEN